MFRADKKHISLLETVSVYSYLLYNYYSVHLPNKRNVLTLVRQHSGLFLMNLEIGYKVFFLMDSSSTDIVIHDSG